MKFANIGRRSDVQSVPAELIFQMASPSADDSLPEDQQEDSDDLLPGSDWFSGPTLWSTDWTTETVISQLKRGNINLNPRLQRRNAWEDKRKSLFIESLSGSRIEGRRRQIFPDVRICRLRKIRGMNAQAAQHTGRANTALTPVIVDRHMAVILPA